MQRKTTMYQRHGIMFCILLLFWALPVFVWADEGPGDGDTVITADKLDYNDLNVGNYSTGSVTQPGWKVAVGHNLRLGVVTPDSYGSYSLSGGTLSVKTFSLIGFFGTGSFAQSGGTHLSNTLSVGNQEGSKGDYLNGGLLKLVGATIVGDAGNGSFTQNGGRHNTNSFSIGQGIGKGYYTLNGGNLEVGYNENIGYANTGSFVQKAGMHTIANNFHLGYFSGVSGYYELNGGDFRVNNFETIGLVGTGRFTQSGGNNIVNNDLNLGYSPGGNGTYALSGGNLSAGSEYIGRSGNGSFVQSGGTNAVTSNLYVAFGASVSNGSYVLSDSGILSVNANSLIGYSGNTGSFIQTGGIHKTGALGLGSYSGTSGSYTLTGGILLVNSSSQIGNFGTGSFTQSGGTHKTGSLIMGNQSSGSGTYRISGGTATAGTTSLAYNSHLDLQGGLFTTKDISIDTSFLTGTKNGVLEVTGDFTSSSTQNALWHTNQVSLLFTGGDVHDLSLTGLDLGGIPITSPGAVSLWTAEMV